VEVWRTLLISVQSPQYVQFLLILESLENNHTNTKVAALVRWRFTSRTVSVPQRLSYDIIPYDVACRIMIVRNDDVFVENARDQYLPIWGNIQGTILSLGIEITFKQIINFGENVQ
jgi:hypothetical protein